MLRYVGRSDSLKKLNVAPPFFAPNLTGHSSSEFPQFFKSSTLLIFSYGVSIVRNAAKLAVYDDTMIKVKNHHIDAVIRVAGALPKSRKNFYLRNIK